MILLHRLVRSSTAEHTIGLAPRANQRSNSLKRKNPINHLQATAKMRSARAQNRRTRKLRKRIRHSDNTLRSEKHTSELQSLMRISYAVVCLKKKKTLITPATTIKTLIKPT